MKTRTRLTPFCLAAIASLGVASAVIGQDTQPARPAADDLPTAEKILELARKAMGGESSFKDVKSLMSKAAMSVQGMEIAMTSYWARGEEEGKDKVVFVQTMPMMGEMRVGSDGDTHWSQDPMQGFRLLSKREFDGQASLAAMHIRMVQADDDTNMATAGVAEFNGKECYRIKMTPADSTMENQGEQYFFVDRKTHLPQGVRASQPGPGGQSMNIEMTFDGWKKFEDLHLFTEMRISQGPMPISLKFSEIEINKVESSVFELPDAIKRLKGAQDSDG